MSVFLELLFRGRRLGKATGFVIRGLDDTCYLVTNWHVVTGRNAETGRCLSRHGAIPDQIRIHHHSRVHIDQRVPQTEDLYSDDELFEPRWLEHPRGREIDVVLLPLANVAEPVAIAGFSPAWADAGIVELPGLPVSIIGYPYGLHVGGRWPIWKTGHLATDPGYNYDDRPSFLIDVTTRVGMSGSPIVYQSPGPFNEAEGEQVLNARMQVQFMGVYSGRIHRRSELGRGWRPEVIGDILDAHNIVLWP